MQAKLKTKTYDCINVRQSNANDGANVLSLLLSGVEDLNELKAEATGCDRVEVTNDGGEVQVYEDYVNYLSLTEGEDTVEVTMQQPSLVKQVASLKEMVKEQAETIRQQSDTIERQTIVIAEQQEQIGALNESQGDQDDAINYLLMGEEE